MSAVRRLRVLLAANDGFSAGHVARAVAVGRGVERAAARNGLGVQLLLVTTSDADALYADAPMAVVRLPNPRSAQRANIADLERRRLARALVDAAAEAFAPDLIVIDTFPKGPHGELEGLLRTPAKRALVRRHVRADRANDDALTAGIDRFDQVLLADDPGPIDPPANARSCVRVPPITLGEPEDAMPRDAARKALGIPNGVRSILVAAGGGGDVAAGEKALSIASTLARSMRGAHIVIAEGPLTRRSTHVQLVGVHSADVAPLQPYLAAFDYAFSAAGYNSAHEIGKANIPMALFAEERPFDDQRARAARFEAAGLACVLREPTEREIAAALAWDRPRSAAIPRGGADRAGESLVALATGGGS